MQLKRYDRARDFLRTDSGSDWAISAEADLLLHEGRTVEAAAHSRGKGAVITPADFSTLVLRSGLPSERDRVAGSAEAAFDAVRDPEPKYFGAGYLAVGGYPEAAMRLLRRTVEGNYLCSPAMDNDPLLESLRKEPEFAAIRAEAIRKQKVFLERRAALR